MDTQIRVGLEWAALEGHRSLRVGSLRIVYRLDEAHQTVLVLDIAQRGGVYR